MKKIIASIALIIGTVSGFSQGQVSFGNSTAFNTAATTAANGHTDRFVYDVGNVIRLAGTNYLAQLYYGIGNGLSESSLNPIAGDVGSRFRASTTSTPGTWANVTKTFPDAPANTALTLQVRVWDGSLYASYANALANGGVTGKSSTFSFTTPAGSPPPTAGLLMENFQSFTLAVPEPSTYALASLIGGAFMLIRARRK